MNTILTQIIEADDLQARRISAAENLQREDLSTIETIEAIVEIVDAELIKDKEYASMGKKPADRVKALLGQLDSIRRSQSRKSEISASSKFLSGTFAGQVEKIFKNLPKALYKRGRWFQNDLTKKNKRDRPSICQDNRDLMPPGAYIMSWAGALVE